MEAGTVMTTTTDITGEIISIMAKAPTTVTKLVTIWATSVAMLVLTTSIS